MNSLINFFSLNNYLNLTKLNNPTEKKTLVIKKIVDEKKCTIKTCPGNKWNKNGEEQKYCYTHSQKLLNFNEEENNKDNKNDK